MLSVFTKNYDYFVGHCRSKKKHCENVSTRNQTFLQLYRKIVQIIYAAETWALKKAHEKGAPSNLGSPTNKI